MANRPLHEQGPRLNEDPDDPRGGYCGDEVAIKLQRRELEKKAERLYYDYVMVERAHIYIVQRYFKTELISGVDNIRVWAECRAE